jgi:hypothetical protein
MPQADVEHALCISLLGYRSRTVRVRGEATVFYSQSQAVSTTNSEGSLQNGEELTIEATTYFIASTLGSEISIVRNAPQTFQEGELPPALGTLSGPSPRAQAQAQQTLLEPVAITLTEESATTISSPVEIAALTGGVLNPSAPWTYQQADMAPKSGTIFAVPLQPYVNRVVNGVFPYQVMFDFDGETFGMHFSNGEKNGFIRFWANDQPTKYYEMPKRAGYFLKVNFGSRAQRRVIVEADFNVFFAGLIRSKTDTISAPSEYCSRSFAVMGDSYGRGSGIRFLNSEATASSQSYAYTLGRLLGFTQTRNWSVPGTGFLKGEGAGTYAERLASCLATFKPSVLMLQGSTNDHTFTQAEIETAVASAVNTVQSQSPSTKVIACNVMPVNNEARTENATNAEALRKAFTKLNIPFVDGYKAEWITGTGKVGAETGEGNSDFYSSAITAGHPSLGGHNQLALRLAQGHAPNLGVAL